MIDPMTATIAGLAILSVLVLFFSLRARIAHQEALALYNSVQVHVLSLEPKTLGSKYGYVARVTATWNEQLAPIEYTSTACTVYFQAKTRSPYWRFDWMAVGDFHHYCMTPPYVREKMTDVVNATLVERYYAKRAEYLKSIGRS